MKDKNVFVVLVTSTQDTEIKPRVAKTEEKAFEIKNEMVNECLNEMGVCKEELYTEWVDDGYCIEENEYSFTIHSEDFSFYLSVYIECLEIE